MEAGSVNCCVTSPPYFGLRDYGNDEQIGLEETPEAFVESIVNVFREVKRVLADDGTLWLNLGDSYFSTTKGTGGKGSSTLNAKRDNDGNVCGKSTITYDPVKLNAGSLNIKPKDLIGIPWRVALALQSDGWYLRQDIIWSKPNPMPESVTDRCTKAHEYIFLLSKSPKYFYDNKAIMESALYGEQHAKKSTSWGTDRKHPNKANVEKYAFKGENNTCSKMEDGTHGRNKRSVWEVTTKPYSGAHFATFPPDLIKPCILAGTKAGDTVLDPFGGSGTTGMVALELGRSAELIELNPDYAEIAEGRTHVTHGLGL